MRQCPWCGSFTPHHSCVENQKGADEMQNAVYVLKTYKGDTRNTVTLHPTVEEGLSMGYYFVGKDPLRSFVFYPLETPGLLWVGRCRDQSQNLDALVSLCLERFHNALA